MKYCVCKQCNEKLDYNEDLLWTHLQLDHIDRFRDMYGKEKSEMIDECYRVVEEEKYTFVYSGPVLRFGKIISNNWSAKTVATSKEKAISQFMYRFKKDNNLEVWAKIELPGELRKEA